MKIKKIFAESFGKLKKAEYEFAPGVNVIVGANESGKSSLTRFIRFMLYGFGNARTDADKTKYVPWDGDNCKGLMELECEDGFFTVRREQSQRASHSITTEDGTPVFKGECAGEALLGVNGETFDRTAMVSAGDVFFKDTVSLSTAVKNMVFSADSTVDSDEALKKLEKLTHSILGKAERSGRLYEARKELAELTERQNELERFHRELLGAESSLDGVRSKIKSNNAKIEILKAERNNIEAFEAIGKCEKIDKAREKEQALREIYEKKCLDLAVDGFLPDKDFLSELNDALNLVKLADVSVGGARNELEYASQALKACYGNTRQLTFNNLLDEAGKTPEEVEQDIALMKARQKKTKVWAILLTVLVVTVPVALFLWLRLGKIKKYLDKLVTNLGCNELAELEYLLSNSRESAKAASDAKARLDKAKENLDAVLAERGEKAQKLCFLLDKCGYAATVTDSSEITVTAKEQIKKLDAEIESLEEAEDSLKIASAELNSLLASVSEKELREKAAQYTEEIPLRDVMQNARELDFHMRANEGLYVQEREFEKRAAVIASNIEKPDELAAKINSLAAEIAALEMKHAALVMASEVINDAHTEMRGNFSPVLTEKASKLFSQMTDGKYIGLYVDETLTLSFLEQGSAEYRSVDYLSSGAVDAAYIALRITLASYLYNEAPVLIFDDAFSRLDDERLEKLCDILKQLSEEYQIIVLSCHEREASLLGGNVIRI